MKKYIKASRDSAFIGIWWYTDSGDIWAVIKPTDDGVLDGQYIQYSDKENHLTLWRKVVSDNVSDPKLAHDTISKGYKSLERGRVIYNTAKQCYEVICSDKLVKDTTFRNKIVDYFQLSGNRVEFESLNHYYKYELTGNPALDNFEY